MPSYILTIHIRSCKWRFKVFINEWNSAVGGVHLKRTDTGIIQLLNCNTSLCIRVGGVPGTRNRQFRKIDVGIKLTYPLREVEVLTTGSEIAEFDGINLTCRKITIIFKHLIEVATVGLQMQTQCVERGVVNLTGYQKCAQTHVIYIGF